MFGMNKKTAVGIDIGSHSIKMVEIEKREHSYRLRNFVIKELIPDGKTFDSEGPTEEILINGLREAAKAMKIKPSRILKLATSVGGQSVSAKQIKSISLSAEELESALTFEARKYLPPDEAEAVIDFQVLDGDVSTSHMTILLVACARKAYHQHVDLLESAGFKTGVVDVDSLAIANAYLLQHATIDDGIVIILNMGARRTTLIVYDPNGLFFTRDLPFGGNHFTEDIKAKQSLNLAEAEIYKKRFGIFSSLEPKTSETGEISLSDTNIELSRRSTEENMVNEINRSIRYYVKESGRNEFRKILLTGGSARIPQLDTYFAEKLRIPVEVFNPLHEMDIPKGLPINHSAPQLSQAVGLALRRLHHVQD